MRIYEIIVDHRINYLYKIKEINWQEQNEEKFGIGCFTQANELPDFFVFQKQFLVSKALKQVIEMYTDEVEFVLVVFSNLEAKEQKEYYKLEVPYIDALSPSTPLLKNGEIQEVILQEANIEDWEIFRIRQLEINSYSIPHLFVHLDIVESILRRPLWGMQFKKVRVEEAN